LTFTPGINILRPTRIPILGDVTMNDIKAIDYERAVEIAEGVYWVGFYDSQSGLHCNPFLIVDGDEAVVIDGGSRPDFPTVMMKILQTGISPKQIRALIYQHYDPDLCASLPSFEDIIGRKDLRVISAAASNMFIRHYTVKSKLEALENIGSRFEFSSGRILQFIKTPYAHSQGSHVTFDDASGILFSSDLFGSYGTEWSLYLNLSPECLACSDFSDCRGHSLKCPMRDILKFHEKLMPSEKSLQHALKKVLPVPFTMIAPQHGSIIKGPKIMRHVIEQLAGLKRVGIDALVEDGYRLPAERIRKRFGGHAD
jgi:flavorubredoxin